VSEEIGAVYQVDVEYAGGYLIRDHAASETTLEVVNGWDFSEEGGEASIDTHGPVEPRVGLFRKWSGDSVGGGDDKFDQMSSTVTEVASGDRSPRLQVSTSDSNGFVVWGDLGIGETHAVSLAFELPEYPSSNVQLMTPLDAEGAKSWQLNIQSTGVMRLRAPDNSILATGSVELPTGERIRVEVRSDGTNISATAYDVTGEAIETITAQGDLGDLYNFRAGSVNKSTFTFYMDDIALVASNREIGDWWQTAPRPVEPRVGVIGDSLTAQDGQGKTRIVSELIDSGYLPESISFYAVGGKEIELPDVHGRTTVQDIADARAALGGIEKWIIALGTNNVYMTDAEIESAMDTVLAALGDDEFVWMGLAFKGAENVDAARVNPLIQAKVEAAPNGTFLDWNSYVHNGRDETGLWGTEDSTHMSEAGYALRNEFMVDGLGEGPYFPSPQLPIQFTYSEAEYPDPEEEDDDLPTVLTLDEPIGTDLAEGEFVKVLPEASEKIAWVEVRGFGEAVRARVEHALVDLLPEGPRGTPEEAETVELSRDSFGAWIITNIVGREPERDLSYSDTTVPLPPAIIPEEGVTQFSQAVIDEAVIDHLEGDVAVLGSVIAALRQDDGSVDPNGNIVKLSAMPDANLIEAMVPTGDEDEEGNLLYRPLLAVPSRSKDPNGESIALDLYDANMRGGSVTARSLTAAGDKDEGDVSSIEAGSRLVVRNAVSDPKDKPSIDFGPKTRRWLGIQDAIELGWGEMDGLIVQGRNHVANNGNETLDVWFINPNNGRADHWVRLSIPFRIIGGFTAGGGYLYVLGQFTSDSPWAVFRFNPNTGVYAGKTATTLLNAGPRSRMAMSFEDGSPTVTWRMQSGEIGQEWWNTNLTGNRGRRTGITTAGRIAGASGEFIAVGNKVISKNNSARSWSTPGGLTGFGQLPDGTYASTSGDGTLTVYNSEVEADDGPLYAAWTKRNTSSGNETAMSDVVMRNWPARMFATIQSGSLTPGANDTYIYAGSSSPSRTDLYRVSKSAGDSQVTLAKAPSSGANPPEESSFSDSGDAGDIVSEAHDSEGEPLAAWPGSGRSYSLLGSAGQSGSLTVATVTNSNEEYSVTFAQPFVEPPVVFLQSQSGAGPQQIDPLTLRNVTTSGFEFLIRRVSGSDIDVTVGWHAMPATQ